MKKGFFILSILPIAAFCQEGEEDFFYVADFKDEALINICYGEDGGLEEDLPNIYSILEMEEELDHQGLSLLEIDEMDETLLPWSSESLGSEEFPAFIDKKAKEMVRDYDDAFAYDLPASTKSGKYEPSFEKIPGDRTRLVGPPKVVQAKPALTIPPNAAVSESLQEESKALVEFAEKESTQALPAQRKMAKMKGRSPSFTSKRRRLKSGR